MIKAISAGAVLLLMLSGACNVGHAEVTDPLAQLKSCARIEQTADRVACYEELGAQVLADEHEQQPEPVRETVEDGSGELPGAVAAVAAGAAIAEAEPERPAASSETSDSAAEIAAEPMPEVEPEPSTDADAASPDGEAGVVAVAAAPVLSDEIGGEQFEEQAEPEEEQNRGHVTSCKIDANDKYYFVFENGQIWHQTDGRRFRLGKKCQFTVTVTKDIFGYKMQIDGEESKIRIKRLR